MTDLGSAYQVSQAGSEFAAHVGATDSAARRQVHTRLKTASSKLLLARSASYSYQSCAVQESLAPGEASRWGTAVGNIEDARVALDTLARAIEDAVYLDEDAYNQVAPVMQFQRTIQVLRWKAVELCLPQRS